MVRAAPLQMEPHPEEQGILTLIGTYAQAVNSADADLFENLFWHDDPRFCEVEVGRPWMSSRADLAELSEWIRQHGRPGNHQRFHDTAVHLLTPDVAYSVSLCDEFNPRKTSRVTLIYLRRGDEWRIIHGHFSPMPE